ncbi:retrovirus-related Pol polyprotein from transposon 412 [Trichonephila clavipes]|nr:retrovirus-related Pol polyprotein from transposon 412 [Trichonephila clavipes]
MQVLPERSQLSGTHHLCRWCRTDPEKVSAVKNWKRPETSLKEALTSSPILIYPQPDKPFILDTDASNESVGAVLSQEIDGQERVVAYWSKCLSKPERNYCVTRKRATGYCESHRAFPSLSLWPKISSTYRSCLFNLANEF